MTAWNETQPTLQSLVKELPSTLTNQMEAFRQGIEQTFLWTQSSGASAGEPLHSSASTKPGAARAFFGPASQVSASKDGRLFVTSDTSRLYAVPSGGSVLLNSNRAVLGDSASYVTNASALSVLEGLKASTRWFVQSGSTNPPFVSTATIKITFPVPYTVAPRVMVMPLLSSATNNGVMLSITSLTGSSMSVRPGQQGPVTSWGFLWRSAGTIAVT